jgi:predicted permease
MANNRLPKLKIGSVQGKVWFEKRTIRRKLMMWLRVFFHRLGSIFRNSKLEQELQEEIRTHLEMQTNENLRQGMALEEAQRAARRSFGGVEQMKEVYRDKSRLRWVENLWQDLRYAMRMLGKNPVFTLIVVITLALGIGANAAVFSVVNAVLLHPLPFPQSERLVYVWESLRSDPSNSDTMTPYNFTDVRTHNQSFDAYFAFRYTSKALTGEGQPESLNTIEASADFGAVMAMAPALGRYFIADEDNPGKNHVTIISDSLWKRRFAASSEIIGQNVQLNGESYTIIGVMPASFNFPNPDIDIWVPLALDLSKYQRGSAFLEGVARLKDGVTLEQAYADLLALGAQFEKQFPNTNDDVTFKPVLLRTELFGRIEKPLLILFGSVLLVLLIACVNVANLVLGRATGRWKEIALRSALGASRGSLIRLLLTESILLAVLGGALGLLLAFYGLDALMQLHPDAIPGGQPIKVDGLVILFTFTVSLLTSALFGLMPAWQATRTDLNRALREDSRTATGTGRLKLIRSSLVVAEISLSLVLLVGAGLLLQSFWKLLHVNPGFRPENVATCLVSLPRPNYPEYWQRANFFRRVLDEVRTLPGVESAAAVTGIPFGGGRGQSTFSIDDRPGPRGSNGQSADRHQASPGYFQVMGIPLLAGRDFTDADDPEHPGVVIINETAAKQFWPDENPIGKRITVGMPDEAVLYGKPVSREIIGIVGNVKHEKLYDSIQPELYLPVWQLPVDGMSLVVRGQGKADHLIAGMRNAVQLIDKDQPIRRARLLETSVAKSIAPQRFVTMLLMLFAGIALLLASIGIYGVMSYTVAQRTHEIGIRMALGAQTGDVLKMVIGQGMQLVVFGVVIGLLAAFALTRLVQTLLFNISATDPITFVAIALLLAGVALVACYIPARRATSINPIIALRHE